MCHCTVLTDTWDWPIRWLLHSFTGFDIFTTHKGYSTVTSCLLMPIQEFIPWIWPPDSYPWACMLTNEPWLPAHSRHVAIPMNFFHTLASCGMFSGGGWCCQVGIGSQLDLICKPRHWKIYLFSNLSIKQEAWQPTKLRCHLKCIIKSIKSSTRAGIKRDLQLNVTIWPLYAISANISPVFINIRSQTRFGPHGPFCKLASGNDKPTYI